MDSRQNNRALGSNLEDIRATTPYLALALQSPTTVDSARIAALLTPFLDRTLPEVSLQRISTYIDLLFRWNARINLTAIRNPEEIVTRHFGESLFLARHLFPDPSLPTTLSAEKPGTRVLDIGSGAGFPGLPLKIWAPHISLSLVESNQKKATFLREVIRTITLTNVNVIPARAETLAATANIVTLRAVERFESILPIASRLVEPKGRLALLISTAQLSTLDLFQDITWSPSIPVPQSHARVLAIGVPR